MLQTRGNKLTWLGHSTFKITTPGDMTLASAILKDITRKPRSGPLGAFEEARW